MGRLEGKIAIVTGGARGQGREHAIALAREGASVVICDAPPAMDAVPYATASPRDLAETMRLVQERGGRCRSLVADVRDQSALARVVETTASEFGAVDILCANAGVLAFGPLLEAGNEVWEVNNPSVWRLFRPDLENPGRDDVMEAWFA